MFGIIRRYWGENGMGRIEGWPDRRNERSPASFTRNDIAVASLSIMRRDRCLFRPLYLWRKIYNGAGDVDASGYWRWNVLSKTLRKVAEVEVESVWATIVFPSRERLIARRSMSTWPWSSVPPFLRTFTAILSADATNVRGVLTRIFTGTNSRNRRWNSSREICFLEGTAWNVGDGGNDEIVGISRIEKRERERGSRYKRILFFCFQFGR